MREREASVSDLGMEELLHSRPITICSKKKHTHPQCLQFLFEKPDQIHNLSKSNICVSWIPKQMRCSHNEFGTIHLKYDKDTQIVAGEANLFNQIESSRIERCGCDRSLSKRFQSNSSNSTNQESNVRDLLERLYVQGHSSRQHEEI